MARHCRLRVRSIVGIAMTLILITQYIQEERQVSSAVRSFDLVSLIFANGCEAAAAAATTTAAGLFLDS
jgi:hypothetical protein